jgi:hypothetical protein
VRPTWYRNWVVDRAVFVPVTVILFTTIEKVLVDGFAMLARFCALADPVTSAVEAPY